MPIVHPSAHTVDNTLTAIEYASAHSISEDSFDIATDVNLYKSTEPTAGAMLTTDNPIKSNAASDLFIGNIANTTNPDYSVFAAKWHVGGGTYSHFWSVNKDGKMEWGAWDTPNTRDVNLYRRGANNLATDDRFTILRPNATDRAIGLRVGAESYARFATQARGRLRWGSGVATLDTNLYRLGADTLKTDDNFYVVGNILTDGNIDGVDLAVFKSNYDIHDHGDLGPTGISHDDLTNISTEDHFIAGTNLSWNGTTLNASGDGGVGSLSDLIIDASKDWQGKNITNMGSLVLGTTGTITSYDIGEAVKITGNMWVNGELWVDVISDTDSAPIDIKSPITVWGEIISDSANADDLGSTSKEWKNLYLGSTLFLGTGQEVKLTKEGLNSPCEYYVPILSRMSNRGIIYYKDPYFEVTSHHETHGVYHSWITTTQFAYGNYEFKGKIGGDSLAIEYPGGLEYEHGRFNNGIICFRCHAGTYSVHASWNGSATGNTLAGQDWTSETTFRFDWISGSVKFYINGNPVNTITTNIPQSSMCLFSESAIDNASATVDAIAYFRNRSFRKL